MFLNVKVKKLTPSESVIEVETRSGVKELVINETEIGYSYNNFSDWDITDKNYYDLEHLVNNVIINRMRYNENSLNVSWEV